jgi:pyruvate formate-lyase activating enzyme-like uncharacterized protein
MKVVKALQPNMTLHYCSSSFKDATQLRKRIMRRAKNTSTPLEIITDDGTFIKGIVECQQSKNYLKDLVKEFKIPLELIRYDEEKGRIEIAAWILEEISEKIEGKPYIVEEYPTADRLEVEKRPLDLSSKD